MNEAELVQAAKSGDPGAMETLLHQYLPMLKSITRQFYLRGAEREDVLQEAMIAFWSAVQNYQPTEDHVFRSFATLCVRRRIISAVKMATRLKHSVLSLATSLDAPMYADSDSQWTLADVLPDASATDATERLNTEQVAAKVREAIWREACLSEREAAILLAYIKGSSYEQIAKSCGVNMKSADNAMQRTRLKTERAILAAMNA